MKRVQLSRDARDAQLEVYQRIAESRSWDKRPVDTHLLLNPDAFGQLITEHTEIGRRELETAVSLKRETGSTVSDVAARFTN